MLKTLLLLLVLSDPVQFASNGDTLRGELDLPSGEGKVPLVVFVHGSGQRTRGDYRDVARRLNEAGFATFRYDKRGVGTSGGNFMEVGTRNSMERIQLLATDAASAVKTLRSHRRVDPNRIIIIGASQAGWIIPVVAGLVDVSATVLISGPTVSVGEEIYYSDLAEGGRHSQNDADIMLGSFKGPKGFDNIRHVAAMKKPSLWIFGGKDVSIPVKKCIDRLDSVKKASRLPVDVRIYPQADHGIYNISTGMMEDYIPVIIDWLKKR